MPSRHRPSPPRRPPPSQRPPDVIPALPPSGPSITSLAQTTEGGPPGLCHPALHRLAHHLAQDASLRLTIDLFASTTNAACPRFMSLHPEPAAECSDTFLLPSWSSSACPWCQTIRPDFVLLFPLHYHVAAAIRCASQPPVCAHVPLVAHCARRIQDHRASPSAVSQTTVLSAPSTTEPTRPELAWLFFTSTSGGALTPGPGPAPTDPYPDPLAPCTSCLHTTYIAYSSPGATAFYPTAATKGPCMEWASAQACEVSSLSPAFRPAYSWYSTRSATPPRTRPGRPGPSLSPGTAAPLTTVRNTRTSLSLHNH